MRQFVTLLADDRTAARRVPGLFFYYPRGFAPRTPLHALSRAASPARSVRVARSLRSLAFMFDRFSRFAGSLAAIGISR
jgi:hypothetical protein